MTILSSEAIRDKLLQEKGKLEPKGQEELSDYYRGYADGVLDSFNEKIKNMKESIK